MNKYINRLKENGFYLLLLLSIVVVTVILVVVSFKNRPNIVEEDIDLNEQYALDESGKLPEEQGPEVPKILEEDSEIDLEEVTNVIGNSELGDNFSIVKEDGEKEENSDNHQPPKNNTADNILKEDKPSEQNREQKQEQQTKETFVPYNNNKDMMWPVTGEVAMAFSMDSVIYDETLDQYRTNDSINIACETGTEVKAAADGRVEKIETTPELGTTIVVDHGNGWKTTYGQLNPEVKVEENDKVNKGEQIGAIADPTIYFSKVGSHLHFKIIKGDGPCDPLEHLLENN